MKSWGEQVQEFRQAGMVADQEKTVVIELIQMGWGYVMDERGMIKMKETDETKLKSIIRFFPI